MTGDEAGDFHEVIDLKDGRVVIVVGDAPGYGPPAAAIADDVRNELRRGFHVTDDVTEVLRRVDARLQAAGEEVMATAAFAVIDPGAGAVHIANAGHLPVVLSAGERTELVDGGPGPPLGIGGARRLESRPLGQDASLLLYSDGLIERRGEPLDEAIQTLLSLCAGLPQWGRRASEFARRATAVFGPPTDDVTVVAARLVPEAASSGEEREPVTLRVYLDPRDLRSPNLLHAVDELVRRARAHVALRIDVVDVTSPSADIEAAGVLAAPTVVRADTRPPVRVIGWFHSADQLADALQLPLPKENR
ncbi:MAG: serine/threonine-protein phosphatase [Actinomycetota bacterium]|nr:serine/threonine-protein phosphatase [Actinomycetota bacterium]